MGFELCEEIEPTTPNERASLDHIDDDGNR